MRSATLPPFKTVLPELSLADAMVAVRDDRSIPSRTRQAWLTALRSLAWAMGRPPESLPCRLTALRHPIGRVNAAAMGWSDKTLSNHKSNATAALRHFMEVANVPKRGVPMSPQWIGALSPTKRISGALPLASLGRYCSAHGIPPGDVTIGTIHDFVAFKENSTWHKRGDVYIRGIANAWNRCVSEIPNFPGSILSVQYSKANRPGYEWEDFPERLRADVEQYLSSLAVPHRSANGKKRRGNKASTVATRRREIMAFARKAVEAGIDIQQLSSLKALLHSATVTRTFESYLPSNGNPAPTYVIDLAWKLLSIARMTGAPAETIANLDDIRFQLEEERGPTLTEKNLVIIRQVISTNFWPKVVRLPASLFSSALKIRNRQPKKAIALAVTALQMQILTRAPIRIGNLLQVKLDKHLVRIAPDKFRLHFEEYDVKNRVDLDFELTGETAEMIDAFITDVRPKLEGKSRTDWLFPGTDNRSRLSNHASTAIARIVEKYIGVRVTAHQFRHAAAAMILKQEPGNYEFARRVLGHKNVVTTQRFYSGLESFAAAKIFGELIESSASLARPTKQPRRRAA